MQTKLLKVALLTRGISKELSYFSLKDIKPGALVSVPLREKKAPAVVLSAENAEKTKTELRQSPYPLKRIIDFKTQFLFTAQFIKAAQKTARYSLANIGSIIKELCPQTILENPPACAGRPLNEIQSYSKPPSGQNSILLLRASPKERIRFYKNIIRSEFAKKHSVFLCVPSSQEAGRYEKKLKKGIEKFSLSLSAKMAKKELEEKWIKALKEKHPVLIMATGLFLSLPRNDISTIIIENEGSPLYKSKNRPFLDIRTAVENITKEAKKSLILADEIVRTETHKRNLSGEISPAAPVSSRITARCKQILVDMKQGKTGISSELKEMLESAHKKNERSILFVNRRGYGSSTVCNDCGRIIACPRCDTPLVLHKDSRRYFLCHKCLLKIDSMERCPYCKSWKLKTLGYGIQKINEEIQKVFPDFNIFRLDSDIVKTKKQGMEIIKKYLSTSSGALVATDILFSFFGDSVEKIAVVSIDGLFSLPDFRINERIFRLLLRLKMRAKKTFLIQTRIPEHPIFNNVLNGDVSGFYQSELALRKSFNYPPFKTLIKIIREGKNKTEIQKEIKSLEKKLADYNPSSFSAFAPKIKNLYRFYILLRLDANTWPNKYPKLHKMLSSLPPTWKIDVNPESLL